MVGDVKTYSEGIRQEPQVYELFAQKPIGSFSLMLRASANPNSLATAMREAVAHTDPATTRSVNEHAGCNRPAALG